MTSAALESAQELLDKKSIKVTAARLDLLRIFLAHPSPLSAKRLLRILQKKSTRFDRATLFRNLKLLQEAEILDASEFGTGAQFFWLASPSKKHLHFVFCVKCESADPLEHCGISPMVEKAVQKGYFIQDHRVELMGICRSCR